MKTASQLNLDTQKVIPLVFDHVFDNKDGLISVCVF